MVPIFQINNKILPLRGEYGTLNCSRSSKNMKDMMRIYRKGSYFRKSNLKNYQLDV